MHITKDHSSHGARQKTGNRAEIFSSPVRLYRGNVFSQPLHDLWLSGGGSSSNRDLDETDLDAGFYYSTHEMAGHIAKVEAGEIVKTFDIFKAFYIPPEH